MKYIHSYPIARVWDIGLPWHKVIQTLGSYKVCHHQASDQTAMVIRVARAKGSNYAVGVV